MYQFRIINDYSYNNITLYQNQEYNETFCLKYSSNINEKSNDNNKDNINDRTTDDENLGIVTIKVERITNKQNSSEYVLSYYKQKINGRKEILIGSDATKDNLIKQGKIVLNQDYNYYPALSCRGCDCVWAGGIVFRTRFSKTPT